ncbi:MAG: hypothetical protein KC594_00650, partial [Nitrospira sp.]|nr:hypothetical protein [Nitrospira sp.]
GRRARLRISWVTVGVQVPPLAPPDSLMISSRERSGNLSGCFRMFNGFYPHFYEPSAPVVNVGIGISMKFIEA